MNQMSIEGRRQGLADSGAFIGDSMSGRSYDDINAEIKRKNWDRFEKDDKPYILNYADEITSGKYLDRSINQATENVTAGFDQAKESQKMRDSDLGLSLTQAQTSDRASDHERGKTASLIDAENNARLAGTDRESALLAGSHMPSVGK